MEELNKQVQSELLRTLIWVSISFGVAMGIYYMVL